MTIKKQAVSINSEKGTFNTVDILQSAIVATFLAPATSYTMFKYYHDKSKSFLKHLEDAWDWFCKRQLNIHENLSYSMTMGAVSSLLEKQVDIIYKSDPTAKTLIRHILSIGITTYNYLYGITISDTGIKYDVGHIYGNIFAVACKTSVIIAHTQYADHSVSGYLEGASLSANFICEPIIRTQNIISQHRQEQNKTDEDYFHFAANDLYNNPAIFLQGAAEGLAKVSSTAVASKTIFVYWGVSGFLKSFITLENKFLYLMGAPKIGSEVKYLPERLSISLNLNCNLPKKALIVSALLVMDYTLKTSIEFITGFILVPIARSMQDYSGLTFKEFFGMKNKEVHNSEEPLNGYSYCEMNQTPSYNFLDQSPNYNLFDEL